MLCTPDSDCCDTVDCGSDADHDSDNTATRASARNRNRDRTAQQAVSSARNRDRHRTATRKPQTAPYLGPPQPRRAHESARLPRAFLARRLSCESAHQIRHPPIRR